MSNIPPVKPDQAHILQELEQVIGKTIPQVAAIEYDTVGVQVEGNDIMGLGLYGCGLTTLPEPILELKSLQLREKYETK